VAIKLFLSQANQARNVGPGGYTEKAGMNALTKAIAAEFAKDPRFVTKRNTAGDRIDTAYENVTEANRWGADLYTAWHSNASGVRGRPAKGTIGFYHDRTSKGYAVARSITQHIGAISPGGNQGIIAKPRFIEIGRPNAPAVLLEVEGHDWLAGTEFIMGKRRQIARAAYAGIVEGLGMKPLQDGDAAPGKIKLTSRNITVPRQHKPKRAGWWNHGFIPWLSQLRAQGDGDRIDTHRPDDRIKIPVPVVKPVWWRKMIAWRAANRQ